MINFPEHKINCPVIEQMQLVRDYAKVFHRLRKEHNIPLSQPLLDYAYGLEYLFPEFVKILADEINIYDFGYEFTDKNTYWLLDIEIPTEDGWVYCRDGNLWAALYINIPDWLRDVYLKRKEERKMKFKKRYDKRF